MKGIDKARDMQRSKKKWKDLTTAQQVLMVGGAVVQVTLLALAQRDLSRRPAGQIRGPKGLWRIVTLANFAGPLAYFCCGRKGGALLEPPGRDQAA